VRHGTQVAAWQRSGDGSVMNDPLRAPVSILLYLGLPPVRGSASDNCYSLNICGCIWRKRIKISPLSAVT